MKLIFTFSHSLGHWERGERALPHFVNVVVYSEYMDGLLLGSSTIEINEDGRALELYVNFSQDNVTYRDTLTLDIHAINSSGNDIPLSEDDFINVQLNSMGSSIGRLFFEGPFGGELPFENPVSAVYLQTPYSLKYTIDGDDPNGIVPVVVTVSSEDGHYEGSASETLYVKDLIELSLEIPDSAQIWPTLPLAQGGNPNNRNFQDSIRVEFQKNNHSSANQTITLSLKLILPSGGHDHANQPPNNLFGELRNIQTNAVGHQSIISQTDNDGLIYIQYKAPEIGGKIEFTSSSIVYFGTQHVDTLAIKDTLTVKVPHLISLDQGNLYELVGAPGNHAGTNDPCRPDPPTSQHNNNHYGTQSLNTAVQNIATLYDSLHPGIRMRINDMSLEYGGLFDTNNNWMIPHNTHRLGRNVDICFSGINQNNQCVSLNRIQLNMTIIRYTTILIEGNHYHVTTN